VTGRERAHVAHVEHDGVGGRRCERERRLRREKRAAVQLDDALHVRRPRRLRPGGGRHEVPIALGECVVVTALEADRGRRLRAHRGTAERACDVAGVHLDAVAELDEAVQRVEEPLGARRRLDREVGARRVADEEGVAGEHEPRLVAAGAVDDGERAVLGPVPGRVQRAQDDPAELDLGAVFERLVRERRPGGGVNPHGQPVLEREPSVTRDVVGVRVRLEHRDELDLVSLRRIQVLLGRVGRIDDDGGSRLLVADEVRSAPEIVVDELLEQHTDDATNHCGYIS
jgi:hypothetical protein